MRNNKTMGTIKLSSNQSITIKNIEANSKYEVKEESTGYTVTIVGENKGTLNKNINVEFINKEKVTPAVEPVIPDEPIPLVPDEPIIPEETDSPTPITGIIKYGDYIIAGILLLSALILLIFRQRIMKKEMN